MWPLVDLLLQSTAILLVGEALCRLAGRNAPELRHRIRLASVVLVFLLPALAFVMPQWSMTRLAAATGLVEVSITSRAVAAPGPGSFADLLNWVLIVWFTGAVLRFVPFASGYIRMRRLVRQAAKLKGPLWEERLDSLCLKLGIKHAPQLLVSPEIDVPMVFGMRNAFIVLPPACTQWTWSTMLSVLAHEMAHVQRADLRKRFVCKLIASAWWFQPLLVLVLRRMRADSELACDRMALEAGLPPSDYAADLITVARSLRGLSPVRNAAIAMASESDLEARVCALLSPFSHKPRRFLATCSFVLIVTTAMAASAIAVNPKQNIKSTGGTMMRRLIPSALLIAAGLPAATPVPHGPNPNTQKQVSADASGNSKPIRIGGEVQSAKLIKQVPPVYPADARRNKVQGTVMLEVVITEDGVPRDIRVLTSPSDEFSQSTIEAVHQWRYRPTLLNGQPVEVISEVMVNYTLAP